MRLSLYTFFQKLLVTIQTCFNQQTSSLGLGKHVTLLKVYYCNIPVGTRYSQLRIARQLPGWDEYLKGITFDISKAQQRLIEWADPLGANR
jgi:hypothetical protein